MLFLMKISSIKVQGKKQSYDYSIAWMNTDYTKYGIFVAYSDKIQVNFYRVLFAYPLYLFIFCLSFF